MTAPLPEAIEGKYQVLRKVREGGMGAIYQVRHRLLDEIRAIKVLRPQLAANEAQQLRFHREARTAIRLKHPHIAQLYDFAVDPDGVGYIVMEWIDGVTLEQILARHGPPELDLGLEVASQALDALAYLHGRGFIHRDVSPDNLMLTQDYAGAPLVKLIDLGIAKALAEAGSLTAEGTFLGKVRYASPEQFSAAEQDRRSDIYSFGVLLYQWLTGRCPIVGETVQDLAAAHLAKPPLSFDQSDPKGRIPPDLRRIILQTLEKEPDRRIQDATELASALSDLRPPRTRGARFAELETILASSAEPSHPEDASRPGSTQDRLDRRFGPATTPSPDDRWSDRSQAAHKVELLLDRGWLDEAESQLEEAVHRFGDVPELDRLRSRLAREIAERRESETALRPPSDTPVAAPGPAADESAALDLRYQRPQLEEPKERRSTDPRLRWLGGALAVIAAAVIGWLVWTDAAPWSPGPPPAPLPEEFRIEVLSEPPGASIWVDGADSRLITPASVQVVDLPGETVELELRRDGRTASSHQIVLASGTDLKWSAVLPIQLETYTIHSDPEGARVWMGDQLVPGATPLELEMDPQATYALRLELEGHEVASLEVHPSRLDPTVRAEGAIRVTLIPVVEPGTLAIETRYAIRVQVAGESYLVTDRLDIPLEPGGHRVRLTSSKVHLSASRSVTIESGERVVLRPPALARLTVAATPSNCRVTIDGGEPRFVPFTLDIAPGVHEFRFEWPGLGASTTRTEEIRPDTGRLFESAPRP